MQGCSNLLYNASTAEAASQGRRPAYLFELLRRAAASGAADEEGSADGGGAGMGGGGGAQEGLRGLVAGSPHVAKLLLMWTSAQARPPLLCTAG